MYRRVKYMYHYECTFRQDSIVLSRNTVLKIYHCTEESNTNVHVYLDKTVLFCPGTQLLKIYHCTEALVQVGEGGRGRGACPLPQFTSILCLKSFFMQKMSVRLCLVGPSIKNSGYANIQKSQIPMYFTQAVLFYPGNATNTTIHALYFHTFSNI